MFEKAHKLVELSKFYVFVMKEWVFLEAARVNTGHVFGWHVPRYI
jgi:hypothetical protein